MVKVNRINVSQVEGGYSDDSDKRPNGEMALYNDDNGGFDLVIHDGVNSTNLNKVLGKGKLYGHGADSADGNGYDTIKLIPDIPAYNGGSDQYIIIDPTGPNHIHIRAGGTIDNSNAELIVGGENSFFKVGSGYNSAVYVSSNDNTWAFNTDGSINFPDSSHQDSAGLEKTTNNYVICKIGDNLLTKYAEAKLLTPGGNALSTTNRATLIIMPGNYSLSEEWEIDAEFVDIIGLGSTPLDRGCNVSVTVTDFDINVSANDVRIKGIGTPSDRAFKTVADKPLQVFEECVGGSVVTGIFDIPSFGIYGGTGESVSGTFINCSGGDSSFGGYGGTASGTFTNCSGGDFSFGASGTASGTFTNCVGGDLSFGGFGGTASGTFLRCTLTSGTFQTLSGTGKYRLCIDGNYEVINADAPPAP